MLNQWSYHAINQVYRIIISFLVSKEYTGEDIQEPIPLNLEVFKNLIHSRSEIKVKFNTQYKVFVFQNTEDENVELKYIISALVK